MSHKAIPNGDVDFDRVASAFARNVEKDPARFHLTAEDAAIIKAAALDFGVKLQACYGSDKSKNRTIEKNSARQHAKKIIRKYRNRIRGNDQISAADKICLGITDRPAKLGRSTCPKTPPHLTFWKSKYGGGATGKMHVLRFKEHFDSTSQAKPRGACRIEIFLELVADDEPIPDYPGQLSGGRAWYWRSYTKSPIEVDFPMPASSALVVYWGRWADSHGNVGPFSKTVVAETEGRASRVMLRDKTEVRRKQQRVIITTARMELPEPVESVEAIDLCTERLLEAG